MPWSSHAQPPPACPNARGLFIPNPARTPPSASRLLASKPSALSNVSGAKAINPKIASCAILPQSVCPEIRLSATLLGSHILKLRGMPPASEAHIQKRLSTLLLWAMRPKFALRTKPPWVTCPNIDPVATSFRTPYPKIASCANPPESECPKIASRATISVKIALRATSVVRSSIFV